jgi:arginine exporter protein ArgO
MTTTAANGTRTGRTPVQTVATVVGIVFLLVGVAGFIPGLTTGYDKMSFAGMSSMAMLLGVFQVSILHNIVHLLFGIAGLLSARTARGAKRFLIIGGIIYGVLWLYGLVINNSSSANFVPLNTADNWLHFVLAVGMILLGVLLGRDRTRDARTV